MQAVRRLMVSEASRSDLGKKCYELGPARSEAEIAEFLQAAMNAGKLRPWTPGSPPSSQRAAGIGVV